MLVVILEIIKGALEFCIERILGIIFPTENPAQKCACEENKMAQDIADKPDQAEAVRKLEDDDV